MNAPGSSWDAMLKKLKIGIKFLLDLDMHIFFEKFRKVGISYISNRYNTASNKYLKPYDQKEESKYIIYLGAVWVSTKNC